MTDDRDLVMARVRDAVGGRAARAPAVDFDDALPTAAGRLGAGGGLADFLANFRAAAGRVVEDAGALAALLGDESVTCAYCDPRLPEGIGAALAGAGIEVVRDYDRSRAEDIGAAVTAATGAIAETGTLVLTDADTGDRLAAVAPWVHVALLDPSDIRDTLVQMLCALPEDPNVVFVTGPSQTADVEGILIRGVHGPGIQACLPMAWRNPGETA
jgi:L-lactate dehydrogenase complex protein LldG